MRGSTHAAKCGGENPKPPAWVDFCQRASKNLRLKASPDKKLGAGPLKTSPRNNITQLPESHRRFRRGLPLDSHLGSAIVAQVRNIRGLQFKL